MFSNKKEIKYLFLLIFFITPLILPFLRNQYIDTEDSKIRLVKAAKYYMALHQRQIPPRWIGDVNGGLGSPTFVYFHPFAYVLTSFLHIVFNITIVNSINGVYIIGVIFLAISMYLFLRFFFSPLASLVGSVLFSWSPYHLVQLFYRGVLEESLALVFVPLNLIFIHEIIHRKKLSWVWGAFCFAGMILSHFLLSYIFIPFLLLFFVFQYLDALIRKKTKKKILPKIFSEFLLYLIFGFSMAAFSFFPAVLEKGYVHFDQKISTIYQTNLIPLSDLFKFELTGNKPAPLGLTYAMIFLILLAALYMKKIVLKKAKLFFWFLFFTFIYNILLLIRTPITLFLWQVIPLIYNVAFPVIFYTAATLSGSALGAFLVQRLKNKIFPIILVMLAIITTLPYVGGKGTIDVPFDEYLYIYKGADSYYGETTPVWANITRSAVEHPYPSFLSFKGKINYLVKETKYHRVLLESNSWEKDILVFENFYFPGWEVVIDGEKQPIIITRGDEVAGGVEKGLLAVAIPPGNHEVLFSFKETPLRKFVNLLSLFSFIILSFIFLLHNSVTLTRLLRF